MYLLVMLQLQLAQNKAYFDQHFSSVCSKGSKKSHALGRIASFKRRTEKRRTLMKAFTEPQFICCPLIWMFHSRKMNKKFHRIHQRALGLVYSGHVSSFDELLKNHRPFSIHFQIFKV